MDIYPSWVCFVACQHEFNEMAGSWDLNLRVPRTVGTAGVLAASAGLASGKQRLAFTARSPDALPGLPVVEILASLLGRALEDDLLRGRIPVRDDGRLLGSLLDNGRPFLAALFPLGLGALGGHPRALLAARMLAFGALLAQAKGGGAEMALPVHTHPDGLLHTDNMALGRVPLAGFQLQAVHLAEFLCTLRKDLRSRDLGALHSRGSLGLGHGGGLRRLRGLAVAWG